MAHAVDPSKDEEGEASRAWAKAELMVTARGGRGVAARICAAAELPLSPLAAFQLMSHPDNAAIFRGIERCTYRKVLWSASDGSARASDSAGGQQTVEVENESDWHFLWFKGSIRTRMVVVEDPALGSINIRLAPTGGNAPLQLMTAQWLFSPGRTAGSCQVTLEQEVHPRGLPHIFFNGFRAMAALQVRKTLEDLYAEALRMNAGHPSLAPYHTVVHKTIELEDSSSSGGDPTSVLAAAYSGESSVSTSSGGSGEQRISRSSSSRRDVSIRPGGLRSHPIPSLLDMPCLAGVTGAELAAEAAAAEKVAASEKAAAADAPPPSTLQQRAYALLQKLWVASNAALGAAPNAVAELEEMAVLV